MTKRIVLAYSGGLQSSAAITWLTERHQAEVVTLSLDVGQAADLVSAHDRALAAGAVRSHVVDAREAFAQDIVVPVLKAGALSDARYPMSTGMGRPVMASQLVDIARIEDATIVAHGGVGRDRWRLDNLLRSLNPDLTVVACAAEHGMAASQLQEYVERHQGRSWPAGDSRGRADDNLWGRTTGRRGDDAAQEVPDMVFTRTRPLARCPDEPAFVEVGFDRGVPVCINGVKMSIVELVASLSIIAGEHGVGRLDRVKCGPDGTRSRVVYEAPGAVALHAAHLELARFVSPGALHAFSRTVSTVYAGLIGTGEWFSSLRRALDAFVDRANEPATGTVRLRLFKAACTVAGRTLEPRNL